MILCFPFALVNKPINQSNHSPPPMILPMVTGSRMAMKVGTPSEMRKIFRSLTKSLKKFASSEYFTNQQNRDEIHISDAVFETQRQQSKRWVE